MTLRYVLLSALPMGGRFGKDAVTRCKGRKAALPANARAFSCATDNNPVTRGLVSSPGDWPWSSWTFYYLQDASILRMDRMR